MQTRDLTSRTSHASLYEDVTIIGVLSEIAELWQRKTSELFGIRNAFRGVFSVILKLEVHKS